MEMNADVIQSFSDNLRNVLWHMVSRYLLAEIHRHADRQLLKVGDAGQAVDSLTIEITKEKGCLIGQTAAEFRVLGNFRSNLEGNT